MMGITPEQFVSTFDRINLLNQFPGRWKRDDKFPMAEARIAASAIEPLLKDRLVILVGRNVADAFGFDVGFMEWQTNMVNGFRFAVVPHASGRNRWYNDMENVQKARHFWSTFLSAINFDKAQF